MSIKIFVYETGFVKFFRIYSIYHSIELSILPAPAMHLFRNV